MSFRPMYLATLCILQFALIAKIAPPLAEAIRIDIALGHAAGSWLAVIQIVATAAAVSGTSLALAFPIVAMSRHWSGGRVRFVGLPSWASATALAGAGAFVAGSLALKCVPMLPVDARMAVVLIARPSVAGGLALMIAGVLCAELLRRAVVPRRTLEASERLRSAPALASVASELRAHGG